MRQESWTRLRRTEQQLEGRRLAKDNRSQGQCKLEGDEGGGGDLYWDRVCTAHRGIAAVLYWSGLCSYSFRAATVLSIPSCDVNSRLLETCAPPHSSSQYRVKQPVNRSKWGRGGGYCNQFPSASEKTERTFITNATRALTSGRAARRRFGAPFPGPLEVGSQELREKSRSGPKQGK
jgi:hypothetical protein